MKLLTTSTLVLTCLFGTTARAFETVVDEPSAHDYHFVSHYRVQIEAEVKDVWQHITNLKSWMYEFELTQLTGSPGAEGAVLQLYEGQDFKIQIIGVVPQQLMTIANLPMTFRGEFTTGIGIFTLHRVGTGTEVALTMSRRYSWRGEGDNPLRATRLSSAFQQQTNAMWQDRFLPRLKNLAESNSQI